MVMAVGVSLVALETDSMALLAGMALLADVGIVDVSTRMALLISVVVPIDDSSGAL